MTRPQRHGQGNSSNSGLPPRTWNSDVMPKGLCKLCHEDRDLRESHYVPAALYPTNAKELIFTTREATHAERFEVTKYLLCGDCEQRFSDHGESEVLSHVAAKLVPKKPHEFRIPPNGKTRSTSTIP